MIQEFRQELLHRNPHWLEQNMIGEVADTVDTFVRGYTVDNLTGHQVFVNLIKRVFVEDGLLKDAVGGLIEKVAEHLRVVVQHVISVHSEIHEVLANRLSVKADDCVEKLTAVALQHCEMLAEAQQVTSTTHGAYGARLAQFRKSWLLEKFDGMRQTVMDAIMGSETFNEEEKDLPDDFIEVYKEARDQPQKQLTGGW